MKKEKIIYWGTTGLVSAMMLFSAFGYLTNPQMMEAFVHLGFPSYFRIELAVFKMIGAVVLLLPMIPAKIKDLAYFGFALTFVSAFIAHLSSGDPINVAIAPVIFLGILVVSYIYSNRI